MRKIGLSLAVLMFLAVAVRADFSITDLNGNNVTSLSFSSTTSDEEKVLKITNLIVDENGTGTADVINFTGIGQVAGYLQYLSSSYQPISELSVPALGQATLIVKLNSNAASATAGSYSGAIEFLSRNTSQTHTVNVNYTKEKWTYSNSRIYVEKNSLVLLKLGSTVIFKILIKNIKDGVVSFDVLTGGDAKIGSDQLGEGDPASDFDEIAVQVIRMIGSTAKLKILSSEEDLTATVEVSEGIGTGKLFASVPSHVVRRLKTDPILTINDIVTNGFDDVVSLNPPTVTPEGVSWITLGSMNIIPLNPNDAITIPLIIDSSKAPSGTYSASVILSGKYKDQPVSLTIPYSITFVQDESSQLENNTLGEPIFSVSNTNMNEGSDLTVTISNVFEADEIRLESNPSGYAAIKLPKVNNNEWQATIRFNSKGIYDLKAQVYRRGLSVLSKDSLRVFVGISGISLHARLDKDLALDTASKIIVYDDSNRTIDGASVSINGAESKEQMLTPTSATAQYTVCANLPPYSPTSPCPVFSLNLGSLSCTLSPQFPLEGEQVAFACSKSDGSAVENFNVFSDGEKVANPTSFKKGEHVIEVSSAAGVSPANFTISVLSPAESIAVAGNLVVDGSIKIDLGSSPTAYQILFAEDESKLPTLLEERRQMTVDSFVPKNRGFYTFKSGSVQKTIFVEGNMPWDGAWFGIQKSLFLTVFGVIALIFIVGIVMAVMKKSKNEDLRMRQGLRPSDTFSGNRVI